ncbi:hypothetical protein C4K04_2397 [Pseudomonas chlororaphis]|uniref:Uncharacterized protein n=1 Tax=Pseudomonas chlororaphis TaxID=587753 RepID=A0A3G7TM35_9PSED|nr:hypothetical protein C4K04_2397 [Pseudomonas chlororaphis]
MQPQDHWTKVNERAEQMALHHGEPAAAFDQRSTCHGKREVR